MEINVPNNLRNFVWKDESTQSSFAVTFPNAPDMDLILIGAELHQDIEAHDRLVLHFKGHPFINRSPITGGDPVQFVFRGVNESSTWNGYVHHIKQVNTHQGGNTDIICVGASWVLKETAQKIYKTTTSDKVVTAIANAHGFEAITQRDPRPRDSVVLAGQSYWQLIKRLANQNGNAFRCENTTIYFVSKDKIYQSKLNSAPYYFYVDSEVDGAIPRELRMTGSIINFTPVVSDQAPEMGVRVDRVVTGLNHNTGVVIKTVHPHKAPTSSPSGVVVPSPGYFLT